MSGVRLPSVSPNDVVRALEKDGYVRWRQRGSHLTMYRETDKSALTVPMHFGQTVPKGTLRSIIRGAGLTVAEFVRLL